MKYNLNKEYNNVHQQKKGISDFDTKVPRLAYNALLNYAFLSVVHYAEDNWRIFPALLSYGIITLTAFTKVFLSCD